MGKGTLSRGKILALIIFSILSWIKYPRFGLKLIYAGPKLKRVGVLVSIVLCENRRHGLGMAFGGNGGKLILSLFRIALSIFIIIYIRRLLKNRKHPWAFWLACL